MGECFAGKIAQNAIGHRLRVPSVPYVRSGYWGEHFSFFMRSRKMLSFFVVDD
jgi:hypothetical protein